MNKKEISSSFLQLAALGKIREAFEKYVHTDLRHHNQYFKGDRESLMKAMEESQEKNLSKVFEIKIILEDGEYVAAFSHVQQNSKDRGMAVVHIMRFDGDRIIEMWDV